jgi:Endonuclease/Exonuclease/phosphatase family
MSCSRPLTYLVVLGALVAFAACESSDPPTTPGDSGSAGQGPGGGAGTGGNGGTPGGSCAHDPCASGVALVGTCDSCVGAVCAQDTACCDASWDDICVIAATQLCGARCGGGTAGEGTGGVGGGTAGAGGGTAGVAGSGTGGSETGGTGTGGSETGGTGTGGTGTGGTGTGGSETGGTGTGGTGTGGTGTGGTGTGGTGGGGTGGTGGTSGQTVRVRLMASNQTGNNQKYGPEASRIFQALDPDIVMMQEFNVGDNSAGAIRSYVDQAFGTNYVFFRESGPGIPNGIVSRYPILESGEWDDTSLTERDYAYARIGLPNGRNLWAVSVHLRTTSAGERLAEATELVAYIKGQVPANDLLALGGDFNTDNRTEACVNKLGELFVTASPYPRDQQNNTNTNNGRNKPYDWLLADPDLDPFSTTLSVGSSNFPDGLVFDSRVFTPLSAVAPVLVNDSSSFQHMGVARDFLVPAAN